MQTLHNTINKVVEFHTSFKLDYNINPTAKVSERIYKLRHSLMAEENDEYLEAAQANDLNLIADALGDKLYILCGTIIAHGLQDKIVDVFNEIHNSNMSKLDEEGNPIYREDGKVLKSNNYFKPDIKSILNKNVLNSENIIL